MNVPFPITDELLDAIASRVAEKISKTPGKPLTPEEVGKRLGVTGRTIRRRVESGEIKRVPLAGAGSRVLIPASELERLLNPQER